MASVNSNLLPKQNDAIIAVMGMTGSGKSSLISQFQTNRPVKTGRDLESCTNRVDAYRCRDHELGSFWLIDTPGFDDTYRSDAEVLGDIANWLNQAYLDKIQLTGILYVHAIRETRMGGKAIDSVRSFTQLCGPDALRKVVLVSTFWDMVDPEDGESREHELKSNPEFWADMLNQGSRVFRHYNNPTTSRAVIRHLLNIRTADDRGTFLNIQKEMVDHKMKLHETGAGRLQFDALEKQRILFEQEIARLEAELKDTLKRQNEEHRKSLENLRKDAEEKHRLVEADKARIDATYEDLMRDMAERDEIEAAEEKRKEDEKEEEVRQIAEVLRGLRGEANEQQREKEKREELSRRQRELDLFKWRRRQQQQQVQRQKLQQWQGGCIVL